MHKVGYTIIMIIATLAEFVYLHLHINDTQRYLTVKLAKRTIKK